LHVQQNAASDTVYPRAVTIEQAMSIIGIAVVSWLVVMYGTALVAPHMPNRKAHALAAAVSLVGVALYTALR